MLIVDFALLTAFGSSPLDIYITNPLYRYPGNTVRYLNGRLQDRVYIDVLQLSLATSSNVAVPGSVQPQDLSQWIRNHSDWDDDEKDAVHNLLFNYIAIVVAGPERLRLSKSMDKVRSNWEKALERLGFRIEIFAKAPSSSKSNPPSAQISWQAESGPVQATL